MSGPRFLAICGSLREQSFNRKLLNLAVAEAQRLGAEVDVVEAKALVMPIYDGELEASEGLPPAAAALKERLRAAAGLIIASPEYNYSIPGGLKNAIDWISRPPAPPFKDRWAALMGASTGAYATLRMQPHLRQVLGNLGMYLLPGQVLLPGAHQAFDEKNQLREPLRLRAVSELMEALIHQTRR